MKRESAGNGRKRKSVGRRRLLAVAENAVCGTCAGAPASVQLACAVVAVEAAARNVRRVRGAKFNCLPAPVLLAGPDPAA